MVKEVGINRNICVAPIPGRTGPYGYDPSLVAGILFSVLFGLTIVGHVCASIKNRVWWQIVFAVGALSKSFSTKVVYLANFPTAELIGWAGRAASAHCPYQTTPFLIQIVCLIIVRISSLSTLHIPRKARFDGRAQSSARSSIIKDLLLKLQCLESLVQSRLIRWTGACFHNCRNLCNPWTINRDIRKPRLAYHTKHVPLHLLYRRSHLSRCASNRWSFRSGSVREKPTRKHHHRHSHHGSWYHLPASIHHHLLSSFHLGGHKCLTFQRPSYTWVEDSVADRSGGLRCSSSYHSKHLPHHRATPGLDWILDYPWTIFHCSWRSYDDSRSGCIQRYSAQMVYRWNGHRWQGYFDVDSAGHWRARKRNGG